LLKVIKGRRAFIDHASFKALFPQYMVGPRNEETSQNLPANIQHGILISKAIG
jgi:hypothetical protein